MRFTCSATALKDAMSNVSAIVPNKTVKEIFKCVLLKADNKLTLATSSGEQFMQTAIAANVEEPGIVAVNAQRLSELARETDTESIEFRLDGDILKVKLRNGTVGFPTMDHMLFSDMPTPPEEPFATLDPESLRTLLNRTVFAAGEGSRYALDSVLIDVGDGELSCVATDGKRLAVAKCEAVTNQTQGQKLLDAASAKHLKRICTGDDPFELFSNATLFWFVQGSTVFCTRQTEGRFPRYQDVYPSDLDMETSFVAGPMRQVVRQAMLTTSELSKGIKFRFDTDGLSLASRADFVGESLFTLNAAKCDSEVEIVLDGQLLVDALLACGDNAEFTVKIHSSGKRALLLQTVDGFDYVLMPLTKEKAKVAA